MPRCPWRQLASLLLFLMLPVRPARAGFSGTEAFVPVVRAGGANGIVFSTTLWIQNPGTESPRIAMLRMA